MRMTYGFELELGDVLRDRKIPEHLGAWEYSECDIVNLHPPHKNVAVDPLGKQPPVGGEINIKPAKSVSELTDRICETVQWFRNQGDTPTVSCRAHSHIHVRIVGLRDDIEALRRLTKWVKHNQDYLILNAYAYQELPGMEKSKTARTYLKWDGGRPMPDWMANNIIKEARSFDDFIVLQCCGKDGKSRGRPFRYAINTYCLKHMDTIELRFFRGSLDEIELYDAISLARDVLKEAVVMGSSAETILANQYHLPPFFFDLEQCLGWEKTHWTKDRAKPKARKLYDI